MEGHPELLPLMALGMERVRQKEMGRTVGCVGSQLPSGSSDLFPAFRVFLC